MHVYVQWPFLATSFSCVSGQLVYACFYSPECYHRAVSEMGLSDLEWLNLNLKDWLYLFAKLVGLVMVKIEADN